MEIKANQPNFHLEDEDDTHTPYGKGTKENSVRLSKGSESLSQDHYLIYNNDLDFIVSKGINSTGADEASTGN